MAVTLVQARLAQKSFIQNYWKPPHGACITSVGISQVSMYGAVFPGEDPSDHCIAVGLHTPLPAGICIPSHHDGVRVITFEASIPSAIDW